MTICVPNNNGTTDSTAYVSLSHEESAICKKHGLHLKTGYRDENSKMVGYFCLTCLYEFAIENFPVITDDDKLLFEAAKEAWDKDE